jgi:hypothetical protein
LGDARPRRINPVGLEMLDAKYSEKETKAQVHKLETRITKLEFE